MIAAQKALLLVDLQNDFCKGGALYVPDADAVIPIVNQLQRYFDHIIASKDWHPADHISFANQHPGSKIGDTVKVGEIEQILWPVHCVQESQGSAFHPRLETKKITKIFKKGAHPSIDSYSAFFDNAHQASTGLSDYLHDLKITDIYVAGLAADYCVKYTCLDGVQSGFRVFLILDACRGVENKKGDIVQAIAEMSAAGVTIVNSSDLKRFK